MKIDTYRINTVMGKSDDWIQIPELDSFDVEMLGELGYKCRSLPTVFEIYLNCVAEGRAQFKVEQTKFDYGDFSEEFLVIRVEE